MKILVIMAGRRVIPAIGTRLNGVLVKLLIKPEISRKKIIKASRMRLDRDISVALCFDCV